MTLVRSTDKYKLKYTLEERQNGYVISIEKISEKWIESRSFTVVASKDSCEELLRRLCYCRVTPVSLEYILQDSGYAYNATELSKS